MKFGVFWLYRAYDQGLIQTLQGTKPPFPVKKGA
jgi:hypothetical protein